MRDKKRIASETCTHDYYAASWRIIALDFGTRYAVEGLAFRKKHACASRILKVTSKDILPFSLVTSYYFPDSTHYDFSEFHICINEKKIYISRRNSSTFIPSIFVCQQQYVIDIFIESSINVILVHIDGVISNQTSNKFIFTRQSFRTFWEKNF